MEGKAYFHGGMAGHKMAWEFVRAIESAGWQAGYPENEGGQWAVRILAPQPVTA